MQLSNVVSLLTALIDSGSADNFMDLETVTRLNIPIHRLSRLLRIHATDEGPIGGGIIEFCTLTLLFVHYKKKKSHTW